MARYAISDIHGAKKTFMDLLKKINFHRSDTLYILGDMIDRGPNSRGVLELILTLLEQNYDVQVLKGNHEDLMLQSLENRAAESCWFQNGAKQTIASYNGESPGPYGINSSVPWPQLIPEKHLNFLQSLPTLIELDDFVLVHAGLKFGPSADDRLARLMYPSIPGFEITDPINETSDEDRMWLREFTYNAELLGNKYLVTGHTPAPLNIIKEQALTFGHFMIDGGCVYGSNHGYGNLVALNLDNFDIIHTPFID